MAPSSYFSPPCRFSTPQIEVPPCRLLRSRESIPISVVVDKPPNQKAFYVHSALLTHSSHYFRTALNSSFEEGKSQMFRLEDDDAYAFDLYVQYLYTNDYNVTSAISQEDGGTDPIYYRMHAAAYALGNKLVAPKFKCLVLYKLAQVLIPERDLFMELVLDMAETVYEGTTTQDGHEMRAMLAKFCASRFAKPTKNLDKRIWHKREIADFAESKLTEFIADVMCEVQGQEFSATAFVSNLSFSTMSSATCSWGRV